MQTAKPIDEVMGGIVANVGNNILTQLMAANSDIHALSYMYGHPLELIQNLKEASESKTQRYLQFPCIMLFEDVLPSPSSVKGLNSDLTLNMVIAMSTMRDLKSAERKQINFIPVLRPLVDELFEEMFRSGYFWIQSARELIPYAIERTYWGRSGLNGNDANAFNDYLDAIEIKGLKVTQTMKGTSAVGVPLTVWRTIRLYIKETPDLTKKIQVGGGKFIYEEYAPGPTLTPLQVDTDTAYLAASPAFPFGKMVEYPFYYSNKPNTIPAYNQLTGVWDESTKGNFSKGAYVMLKFLDNV